MNNKELVIPSIRKAAIGNIYNQADFVNETVAKKFLFETLFSVVFSFTTW